MLITIQYFHSKYIHFDRFFLAFSEGISLTQKATKLKPERVASKMFCIVTR